MMNSYRLTDVLLKYRRWRANRSLPFSGYTDALLDIPVVDKLSDSELKHLNRCLPWHSFIVDSRGRRFGCAARPGKRNTPQEIPDRRIQLMNDYFDLSAKHVLEVGCFEGVHTVGLAQLAKAVTAVDARLENVIKTMVRLGMFGIPARVLKYDIEKNGECVNLLSADVMHHVGVLYHLKDPVGHLMSIGSYIRDGLMLDSHYALETEAISLYEAYGEKFRYKRAPEFGHRDVFSGVHDHSKWLMLEDIVSLLSRAGFPKVDIIEKRPERNGARVLLFARRAG
ncbi:MAG: class I SAM-dependent methyltransferase [Burkholderiales bacterium]